MNDQQKSDAEFWKWWTEVRLPGYFEPLPPDKENLAYMAAKAAWRASRYLLTMPPVSDPSTAFPTPSSGVEAPASGLDLEAVKRKVKIASDTLGEFCKEVWAGRIKEAWHWEIPANEERDTDLRIGGAISAAKDLIKEVERLRERLRERGEG